jgi:anti-sigma28 factor (negative regulator of flagellin synthesis)
MHAIRTLSPHAPRPSASPESSRPDTQSPEQNASAGSGTYFRAVRVTASEAAALARGEPVVDPAKVEGLRFELDCGLWRADPEGVAQQVINDAEYASDDANEDE